MARLSCEACTKRKVKCDRLIPCTNCRNSGILCIPVERKRRPRGRSQRPVNWPSQAPLDQRDSHDSLPAGLVQSSLGEPSVASSAQAPNILSTQDIPSCTSELDNTPRNSCAFYDRLESPPTKGAAGQTRGRSDLTNMINQYAQLGPNETISAGRDVNILHRPSIQAHLLEGECYLNYEPWHPAPAALASAIYYAASCTVNQDICLSCFGMDKASLISKYQKESNAALERADYLLTDDLTVLQAFVISLIAMRCHDRTRRFWTMLALALRIAHALSLHDSSPPFPVPLFEKEMRRRLWHAIGLLDIQASLSSATEPMIQSNWVRLQSFHDMNNEIQISQQRKVSETALFHVLSYAQETARQLIIPNFATPCTKSIQQRQQLTMVFKARTDELFAGCQPGQNDLDYYAKELSHSIGLYLQVLAVRSVENSPPSGESQATNINIFRLAVEALYTRCRVYSSVKTQPWRWIASLFFPWQALATCLAEILDCDDLHFVRSVWPLIEQSYDSFTTLGIESPNRRLQGSMKGMMERARSVHDRMVLSLLSHESAGSAFSLRLSPQTIFQYHAPFKSSELCFPDNTSTRSTEYLHPCSLGPQENNVATRNNDSALDEVDLTSVESQFPFEDMATFDVDGVSQALYDASYEELFLQYTQQ
ncbi:hypothetical protein BDV38DRAFT_282762 [Aspergillus pseudotamarii]|uniref:Zn(2)-C6 fungal-type domain-containing protein n=1 Tax=Aspergillus pseudotamarii TaxID=132259 RepID=A0A5N6SXI6_ASPPS|nr:uncharacterized protein BDV38DRAFT_282762 [Aspergillus pseudotamarii]KAE8137834.1 hypothetical protein BDV38DRAFT_282762 [Aspergillus pseudotamarii]